MENTQIFWVSHGIQVDQTIKKEIHKADIFSESFKMSKCLCMPDNISQCFLQKNMSIAEKERGK